MGLGPIFSQRCLGLLVLYTKPRLQIPSNAALILHPKPEALSPKPKSPKPQTPNLTNLQGLLGATGQPPNTLNPKTQNTEP